MRCSIRPLKYLLPGLLLAAVVPVAAQSTRANSPEFFESTIRPILANNCFSCHTQSQLGGLRVDSKEALEKGGKRGPAIVSGDPDKSLLIKAVRHEDPAYKMPMGGKLKDAEISALVAWVKEGAVWPKPAVSPTSSTKTEAGKYLIRADQRAFWSFQPIHPTPAPAVKDAKWAKNDIDRFILAHLEREGLKPVRPAAKRDLIRRAYLDLTGLPPKFEEIQAFEKDTSPDAFAKVVDRLLASQAYGERWGRIWLDVARYGEDDYRSLDPMRRGLNPYPNAHVYRDWVIQAFNDDLPYDQFVRAQLAGDLMDPSVRYKTLPATGFLGLGPWYYDNGSTEVTRADERHDRVDVVTRGFLGMTVACARCHDHKYDPIPTTDYYSLAGIFWNTTYEEYPRAPKSVVEAYEKLEDEVSKKQKLVGEFQTDQSTQLSQTLALQTANYLQGAWEVTGPQKKEIAQVVESRKLDYELLERWIAYMGKTTEKYKFKEPWQAMVKKGGTPQVAKKEAEKFQELVIAVMLERNELNDENKVIANKAMDGTKPKKRTNKPSNFVTNEDFCPGCALRLKSLPEDKNAFWTEVFQRDLSEADDPAAMAASGRMGKPGVLMFRGWGLESRMGAEARLRLESLRNDVTAERKKLEPQYPYLHGVKDSEQPTDINVALRGDPFNLGAVEPRHFLSVLSKGDPAPYKKGSGRLELAEDIVRQPIAMRVITNRIWKSHFETGLVDSPSNFGITGERPTNPELLEYLADSFVKNGLSIKKLHRQIMLSSVYQLGTENDPVAAAKDSGNRLYWRANKKRLDSEQLRDAILAVAGNLDDSLGGPSVELTPAVHRRTVYGKVSRYKLDQYLQLFDFPTPAISAEKRFTTTVPLQRLFMMNSDFVQMEAEEVVKQVANEADNKARVRKAYQIVYGREPKLDEVTLALDYLKKEPLTEYEESKKREAEKAKDKDKDRPKRGKPEGDVKEPELTEKKEPAPVQTAADMPEAQTGGAGADQMPPPQEMMGMGMMGGVMPGARRGPGGAAKEVKYEPSAWGRYVKVLLSSNEFLFIN
ncbi:PSD1 and planctomycete cytochrome C domain-containing protein [uncultured Paludibaculum sp.]|uniref:PSD1 and planctomycete cytochrome C domain-containing protein n=1 Tax=uncultured Paludibaculum sp. TaxID=1765020 RepID=UPI002AABCECA|nr:PSD1 and planctomycete cytochrome C domain-containing protein [uncultured Paludibaculum sp.]